MARIQIELPDNIVFSGELQVRISDLASGLHLGNHMLVAYLNEIFQLFLRETPSLSVSDIDGISVIVADLGVIYKSEALQGDILRFDMYAGEMNRCGLDLFFRVTNKRSGLEVATAKMALLFFDYGTRRPSEIPVVFRSVVSGLIAGKGRVEST